MGDYVFGTTSQSVNTLVEVYDDLYSMDLIDRNIAQIELFYKEGIYNDEAYDNLMDEYRLASRIDLVDNPYEDSPFHARISMVKRIHSLLESCKSENLNVLNLGSGPQLLEWMLYDLANRGQHGLNQDNLQNFNNTNFITLDRAKIPSRHLLTSKQDFDVPNINHINADAHNIPIAEGTQNIVVSNFAIDFIPDREQIYSKVYSLLGPGGKLIANFHHPVLEADGYGRTHICSGDNDYREHTAMYSSAEDIKRDLFEAGFTSVVVKECNNHERQDDNYEGPDETWWEIIATKHVEQ